MKNKLIYFIPLIVIFLTLALPENIVAGTTQSAVTEKVENLELKAEKKTYRLDEQPQLNLEEITKTGLLARILKVINAQTPLEYRIKSKLTKSTGETLSNEIITFNPISENNVEISIDQNKLSPGKYHFEVTETDSNTTIEQDFSWGVLAINTNKSIYQPEQNAELAIAVLNDKGNMVCDAEVKLTITNPSGESKILKTKNGSIKVNSSCWSKEVGIAPDYQAEYQVQDEGEYKINLWARTRNGEYEINDSFQVKNDVPLDVERDTATRIFPENDYPVNLKIKANEDFQGKIVETVPDSFQISQDTSYELQATNVIWEGNLKKGEETKLSYTYNAPNISPEFYFLGPLAFYDYDIKELTFQEARKWQIAVDAPIETTFTESGYWQAPGGVTQVEVECWGGGGAGGSPNGKWGTGGGGGGAYVGSTVSVNPGTTYNYVIGAGATAVATVDGPDGGDTYWVNSSTVMAKGGQGGLEATGVGGSGGSASLSVGDTAYSGGDGADDTGSGGGGGGGGAGSQGDGGDASGTSGGLGTDDNGGDGGDGNSNGTGGPGLVYGGGGGGTERTGGPVIGGAGAQGLIRITYEVATITVSGNSNLGSGTVALAINNSLQTGNTSSISGGTWSISGVNPGNGDTVTAWVDGATDGNESTAVTQYDGDGNIIGMVLDQNVLSIGSSDAASLIVTNMGQYDNSNDEDIMHSVVSSTLNTDDDDVYSGDKIDILSGNSLTIGASETLKAHDVAINGTLTSSGAATYTVSGSWDNNSTFTADTSSITFTSSAPETIDSSEAGTSAFNNFTHAGPDTLQLSSALEVNGTFNNSGGTLNCNSQNQNFGGDFTLGVGTTYTSGGNLTFDGSGSSAVTDDTTGQQNLGSVTIAGTSKTITTSTDIKVTDLTVTDTLDITGDTLTITGSGTPLSITGTFTTTSSTVKYTGTSATNITATGYNNLTLDPGSGTPTYSLANNLTGSNDIDGTLTISSDATLDTGSDYGLEIAGSWSNSGTFTSNSSTVTFDGTGTQTVNNGSSSFHHLTHSGTGTLQLDTNIIDVDGDFSQTNGTFDCNSINQEFAGTFSLSAGTTYTPGGTLTFDGSGSSSVTDDTSGQQNLGSVTIAGTSKTITTNTDIKVTDLTVTDTLDITDDTLTITGSGDPITVTGTFTLTNSTVKYAGSGATNIYTLPYNNLTIDPASSTPTYSLTNNLTGSNDIDGALTISSDGTLDTGSDYDLEVTGDWSNSGSFTPNSSTVTFDGTGTQTVNNGSSSFHHLTHSGTGTLQLDTNTIDVDGDFSQTNGTFDCNSISQEFAGTFSLSAGTTYTPGGTLTFNGSGGSAVTDDTTGQQNLGSVTIAGTSKTITTSTDIKVTDLTVTDTLDITGDTLTITGSGTPLSITGTFTTTSSTVKYTGTSATNITATGYNNLTLDPGSGTPTYSLADHLTSSNDIDGTLTISSDGTLDTTGSNYDLEIAGSWSNSGSFTSNNSTVTFDSSSAGNSIVTGGTAASQDFYDVTFNNGSGSWAIQTNDMKVSHDLSITAVNSFTLDSGRTLEVNGTYSISDSETADTTWTGSTLYLNSGSLYTVGSKSQSAEVYETLKIGASTDIRIWNSSANTTFTVDATGSLYSQDHANYNGDLYIWGDYHTQTNDYWSYETDFDETDISGSPRQVDVRIDPSSSVTVDSDDTLAAIGVGGSATTVSRQGASNGYELIVAGGEINFEYTDFDYLDGNKGIDIQANSTVTSLDNCSFDNMIDNSSDDAFITVVSSVIGSNTTTFSNVQFDNTGSGANFNVNRTGSDYSGYWDFDNSSGDFDLEANDGANGSNEDDPGMLWWDDSTPVINISGSSNLGSGTVALAVNNSLKTGDTAPISGGSWTLNQVAQPSNGDSVTVWVDGATDGNESTAVTEYDGSGSITGMVLDQNVLSIGSSDAASLIVTNMGQYDNSNDEDIMHSVVSSTLNTDDDDVYSGDKIDILSGNSLTIGASETLQAHDVAINGTLTSSGTATYTVSGSWDNNNTFTADTSSITFTSSAPETIDSSGAGTSAFNNFTHAGPDTLQLSSALDVNGTFNNSGGTFNCNSQNQNFGGDFSLSVGTTYTSGGTLTFDGSGSSVINTTGQQNLGTVVIDGSSKTITTNTDITITDLTVTDALNIANDTLTITGSGTPLSVSGTLTTTSSTVKYTGTGATDITATGYNNLTLDPSSGSPTYTLADNLTGANDIDGNLTISSDGTLDTGSDYDLEVAGNWSNSGSFTSNNSIVTFDASSLSKSIVTGGTAASQDFYDVTFNNGSGGWTIQTNDMKVNHDLSISAVNSFTLDSGRTLEVNGTYSIADSETADTTWTGSTLYLNSGSPYTIGSKSQSAEVYETLKIGASTDIRIWNSSANTTFTVDATGSLYSQDHVNTDGDLYIWGDFHTQANDHWSYATDFNGDSLSGSERQVDVRIDPSSSVTVDSGDTLAAIGVGGSATTVSRQGASNGYELIVAGGEINFEYTDFDYLDGNKGLDIQANSTVTSLDNTSFDNLIDTGGSDDAFITVVSSVIGSGLKTFNNVDFTNSGTNAEFNVNWTGGQPSGFWNFANATGGFAGEDHDGANGSADADPGTIQWDAVLDYPIRFNGLKMNGLKVK